MGKSYGNRRPNKDIKRRILIVAEGENTEPSYFKQFRIPGVNIFPYGTGRNTLSLVDEVEPIKQKMEKKHGKFDEVWCVFDKDSCSPQNFDNAIKSAESKGYKVAYSN